MNTLCLSLNACMDDADIFLPVSCGQDCRIGCLCHRGRVQHPCPVAFPTSRISCRRLATGPHTCVGVLVLMCHNLRGLIWVFLMIELFSSHACAYWPRYRSHTVYTNWFACNGVVSVHRGRHSWGAGTSAVWEVASGTVSIVDSMSLAIAQFSSG